MLDHNFWESLSLTVGTLDWQLLRRFQFDFLDIRNIQQTLVIFIGIIVLRSSVKQGFSLSLLSLLLQGICTRMMCRALSTGPIFNACLFSAMILLPLEVRLISQTMYGVLHFFCHANSDWSTVICVLTKMWDIILWYWESMSAFLICRTIIEGGHMSCHWLIFLGSYWLRFIKFWLDKIWRRITLCFWISFLSTRLSFTLSIRWLLSTV